MSEKTKIDPITPGEAKRKLGDHSRRLPSRARKQIKKTMKLRRYPLDKCLVSEDWADPMTLTSIVVSRKMPGGVLAAAAFLVDLTCLGVKSVLFETSLTRDRFEQLVERVSGDGGQLTPRAPELAMRIIDRAVRYALALGFYPDDDYFAAVKLLDAFDPEATEELIPLGDDGVPLYIAGPHDNVQAILDTLNEHVGTDGYHYILPMG